MLTGQQEDDAEIKIEIVFGRELSKEVYICKSLGETRQSGYKICVTMPLQHYGLAIVSQAK